MTVQIQRQLILVRHAKALEEQTGGDHARPLNPRGREDAAALGAWLEAEGIAPGQVLCSTAARTRETLALIAPHAPASLRDKLYLASAGDLLGEIQGVEDSVTSLLVLAHNPGLHVLLARLVADYDREADAECVIMKFPTAACAVLSLPIVHWRDISLPCARLSQLRWAS